MNAKFKELDHKIGRHSSPDEGCPICFPDTFTAGTPRETDYDVLQAVARSSPDLFGLMVPDYPDWGSIWHEPGKGLWVFSQTDKGVGVWVNGMDPTLVRGTHIWWGSGKFHERVRRMEAARLISGTLARPSLIGNIEKEVKEQLAAMLTVSMDRADMMPVSHPVMESHVTVEGEIQYRSTVMAIHKPNVV